MADLPDGTAERYTCANCGAGGLGLYGHYRIRDGIGFFTCDSRRRFRPASHNDTAAGRPMNPYHFDGYPAT